MKVFWTAGALAGRREAIQYIETENPSAAVTMERLFIEAAKKLEQFPAMGHEGSIPGTREVLPHHRYRLIYEIDEANEGVYILALVHTARLWPPVAGR